MVQIWSWNGLKIRQSWDGAIRLSLESFVSFSSITAEKSSEYPDKTFAGAVLGVGSRKVNVSVSY